MYVPVSMDLEYHLLNELSESAYCSLRAGTAMHVTQMNSWNPKQELFVCPFAEGETEAKVPGVGGHVHVTLGVGLRAMLNPRSACKS